ncbi:hypothetical protein LNKW23_39220 [Paralimibaculum aggregatum]|uniref:PEP-CTERM protein-sorting domain-containing protein n=1 Tax=Paralimibaculum aggregatum TaxID=3036245 RepID=A0ABQ6LND7_9RHOB|nr:hypothetical protein [Limibaculum sp. NKW23]GMG84706.1 hypothetical protein LNKW23_39220 [Limibaculum sp. NKW23]
MERGADTLSFRQSVTGAVTDLGLLALALAGSAQGASPVGFTLACAATGGLGGIVHGAIDNPTGTPEIAGLSTAARFLAIDLSDRAVTESRDNGGGASTGIGFFSAPACMRTITGLGLPSQPLPGIDDLAGAGITNIGAAEIAFAGNGLRVDVRGIHLTAGDSFSCTVSGTAADMPLPAPAALLLAGLAGLDLAGRRAG